MSFPSALDAQGLHRWAQRTVAELSHRRAEINALNVFPVPDADTGSNMAHTMEAALAEVDKGGDVAEALAIGSVRGARGNSGMVLSQVLRGVADATVDSRIDGPILAQALNQAVVLVERAISTPVEGTVISVLRAAAQAASEAAAEPGAQLHEIVVHTIAAARVALDKTPSQLAVLREAGVVDAGGTGFLILLEALLAELEGARAAEAEEIPDSEYELEVVFFYEGDVEALESAISPQGNSLIVARADESSASVHIHTFNAGGVIETAFGLGAVSGLRLEVLPAAPASSEERSAEQRRVFVLAPSGPVSALFETAGAQVLAPGESAAGAGASKQDIFLANGYPGEPGPAQVVSTDSLVSGLAAISVYQPDDPDTQAMLVAMNDAARSMRVGRPARESPAAVLACCQEMLAQGGEQITILTEQALDEDELSRALGVDVVVLRVAGMSTEIGVE
ncbi:DAK2 domain-containing protein [Corynebacterium sp.]|uniref:DAK2 domain-containing protein n=1 Tax=Corynebacterium sp. TaxID=1720 RepID=UPI0026DC97F1|nr:DAK2 domain-containing protein [Corynebacterium sp.]MDO5031500.1 DAK2 domain-containing protein [Corynebacterium sp.]